MSENTAAIIPIVEVRRNLLVRWLNDYPHGGSNSTTPVSWEMPEEMTRHDAVLVGKALATVERAVGWWIGDWYIQCDAKWGGMEAMCAEAGINYGTARVYATHCRRVPVLNRFNDVPFTHHMLVSGLPEEKRQEWLETAKTQGLSVAELRGLLKQDRRTERETELAESIEQASVELGSKLYGVIYADPPWRFEPYSRTTGMDRAADNHYPTMPLEDICGLEIPAADDCVLFLWATVPMLFDAAKVMTVWGFEYRGHFVWVKHKTGTGYWNRNRHELLLVGVRGHVPAPAPGTQYESVIEADAGEHSAKPAVFAEMIEDMFPHQALLEMFARGPRLGWDVWGAEAETEPAE